MATNVNVNTGGSSGMMRRDLTGRSTIAGMFHNRADAEAAIDALKDAGFSAADVGVAMRDRTAQGQMVEDTGTKAAEGATSGALGGGLLGGVVGFLVGLGALAIPGIGPVVAGGMLASAFGLAGGTAVAGAGIGAAAGGLVGALVGMGIPEEEARHFESGFRSGGTLVTVRGGARAMDAMAILESHGADTGPGSVGASSASSTVTTPGHDTRHTGSGETTTGAVAGGLAGAAAGAAIGTMVAPGPGTAAGAAIGGTAAAISGTAAGAAIGTAVGAMGGAAAGKGIHEARPADHKDEAAEGTAGGGLAGGAAGAAIGTVVAGPGPGTIAGAAIGGAAGAATGGSAGAKDDDEDDRSTTTTVTRR